MAIFSAFAFAGLFGDQKVVGRDLQDFRKRLLIGLHVAWKLTIAFERGKERSTVSIGPTPEP